MEKIRTKSLCSFVVFAAFLLLLPSIGLGQTVVNCPGNNLQAAINGASAGAMISVTGICNENISIPWDKTSLTLDGGGAATINALSSTQPTVTVLSRYASIKGLTITGGIFGIQVVRGATANIDGNIIQSGSYGIILAENSYATIINNTVHNNPTAGIIVVDSSFADIGVTAGGTSTVLLPNNIQNNATGIIVSRSSSAQIVGNTISNNTGDGVQVAKVSHADIANNTIDGNGQNGILVVQNSGVNLGRDTGSAIRDLPNVTTVNNGGYGLRCAIGGYADGRLGTLNGTGPNPTSFTSNCINSLIPLSAGVPGVPYYVGYGGSDYLAVPGDYDGDGKTDIAVYHPPSGLWFIKPSSGLADYYVGFGGTPYTAVPGDYNGDGKTDIAVYHGASGLWFIIPSSGP